MACGMCGKSMGNEQEQNKPEEIRQQIQTLQQKLKKLEQGKTTPQQMEQEAQEYFRRIDALGGVLPAIQAGFFQREIADSAYRYQQEIDAHERIVVGINDFLQGNEQPVAIPIHTITAESEQRHLERLRRVRRERDQSLVASALQRLENAARDGRANLMPYIVEAVRSYATLGEMCNLLRGVYGEYREPALV